MKKIYYLMMAAIFAPGIIYAQPTNDNCSGALPIEINGAAVTADNSAATYSGPEGSCYAPLGDMSDGNVWFTFTITETMTLLIATEEGTSDDSQMTLFTIADCNGPNEAYTEIGCSEDVDFMNYMSNILLEDLEPGTYYISASTFSNLNAGGGPTSNAGTYSISVISASLPDNDTCDGAVELVLDGISEPADNSISSIVGPEGTCYNIGQEVGDTWFMFTLSETTSVRVYTEAGTSTDSQVAVFTIEGCGTGSEVYTEVGCNDDASGDNSMSIVDMIDLPAGTYYVKAGTYHAFFTGTYEIMLQSIVEIPENDNCAGALPIEVDGDAVTADNSDATSYGPQGSCLYGDQSDGDVWFTFTLTEATTLSIQTEAGSSSDSQLTLFTIEDCGGGDEAFTEIACNDDISFTSAMSEILTDELPAGTYYIAASTFSNEGQGYTNSGTYSITVSSVSLPDNNSCEGAVELILDGDSEIADNSVSTIVGPEGSCYSVAQEVGDTWFVFTLTETTSVLVFTEEGESVDSQVSVFTIEGCGTGNEVYTEVGCNDDASDDNYMSIIQLMDLPAGTYYIKAGTYSSYFTGAYPISIETLTFVGIDEAVDTPDFTIYPNPSNGDFSIDNGGVSGNYSIELIDLTGRKVHSQTSVLNANSETNVSVNGIAPGVYMLRMTNTNSNSFTTQRIVVK